MVNIIGTTAPTGQTYRIVKPWDLTELPDGVRQRAVEELGRWVEMMRLGAKAGLFQPQPFSYIDDGKGGMTIRDGRTGKTIEKIDEAFVDAVLPRVAKGLRVEG
jgi:hypothetical protein